jgi:hypothetical protein
MLQQLSSKGVFLLYNRIAQLRREHLLLRSAKLHVSGLYPQVVTSYLESLSVCTGKLDLQVPSADVADIPSERRGCPGVHPIVGNIRLTPALVHEPEPDLPRS